MYNTLDDILAKGFNESYQEEIKPEILTNNKKTYGKCKIIKRLIEQLKKKIWSILERT